MFFDLIASIPWVLLLATLFSIFTIFVMVEIPIPIIEDIRYCQPDDMSEVSSFFHICLCFSTLLIGPALFIWEFIHFHNFETLI